MAKNSILEIVNMQKALIVVFKRPVNLVLAIVVALLSFSLSILLVNYRFILEIIENSSISFIDKIKVLSNLLISINTSFTTLSALTTIIISILLGVSIAMVFYIYKRRVKTSKKGLFASIGGFVSGIFGVGCASCGALLITPILSLVGAGWLISILPFGGEEFGFVSIGIFIFAIFIFSKRIVSPVVCEIKN